jgi:hypothetical protein
MSPETKELTLTIIRGLKYTVSLLEKFMRKEGHGGPTLREPRPGHPDEQETGRRL